MKFVRRIEKVDFALAEMQRGFDGFEETGLLLRCDVRRSWATNRCVAVLAASGCGIGEQIVDPMNGQGARRVFGTRTRDVGLAFEILEDLRPGEVVRLRDFEGDDDVCARMRGDAFCPRSSAGCRPRLFRRSRDRSIRATWLNHTLKKSVSSVIVPTVEREVLTVFVCSIAIDGRMFSIESTLGLSSRSRNCRVYALNVST